MSDGGSFLAGYLSGLLPWLYADSRWWTAFGLLGNLMFSSRFVIQWLYSEKLKRVVVPPVFWHLSFWGSVIALLYAFHVDKLPVILGYFFLPFLYARNLVLLFRGQRADRAAAADPEMAEEPAPLHPEEDDGEAGGGDDAAGQGV